IDTFTRKPFLWGICFCFVAQLIPYCRGLSYFSCQSQFLFALISGLDQIEATKLNPPSKPWRSSLRMPKTQCSGPKNHVTLRAVFNAMRSTEVFGLNSSARDRRAQPCARSLCEGAISRAGGDGEGYPVVVIDGCAAVRIHQLQMDMQPAAFHCAERKIVAEGG